MKYYKAKRDSYDYFNKFQAIENELLTEKERNTFKTFFNFGCRFECKD